jgi:uncharacterized protein (UPF0147 family)
MAVMERVETKTDTEKVTNYVFLLKSLYKIHSVPIAIRYSVERSAEAKG